MDIATLAQIVKNNLQRQTDGVMMMTNVEYVTPTDSVFFHIFKSNTKSCSKEMLLRVLSAIDQLNISSEGQGGKTAFYGDDYEVGTGLRAPDMPFYYKSKASRRAVLKHLEHKKMITITNHDEDEWEGVKITDFGKEVLSAFHFCPECQSKYEWYNSTGYYQSGNRSGYRTNARVLLCTCKKKKFLKLCAASKNTNHRQALGSKIINGG